MGGKLFAISVNKIYFCSCAKDYKFCSKKNPRYGYPIHLDSVPAKMSALTLRKNPYRETRSTGNVESKPQVDHRPCHQVQS